MTISSMHQLDLTLFYYLHSLAGQNAFLDSALVFVATYLIYIVILGVAAAAVYAWHKGARAEACGYSAAIVSGLIARYVVAGGIRHFYMRLRPFDALHTSHLIHDSAASFPSGHTIFMFALGASVYSVNKKLGLWLCVFGLVIGIARVAAGVHYPSDILGGIVLGTLTGLIVAHSAAYLIRSCKKV